MTTPDTAGAPTRRRVTWRDRLDPFADDYSAMTQAITARVASLPDDELTKLLAATTRPTQTNVSWAVHSAAPHVADAVRREQYRRKAQTR